MNFFKKIGGALKIAGKVSWMMYKRPEGKVLLTALVPVLPLTAVTLAIAATEAAVGQHKDNRKRDHARQIILQEFPVIAESGNDKLINFMIEAKLQELAGNLDIN